MSVGPLDDKQEYSHAHEHFIDHYGLVLNVIRQVQLRVTFSSQPV